MALQEVREGGNIYQLRRVIVLPDGSMDPQEPNQGEGDGDLLIYSDGANATGKSRIELRPPPTDNGFSEVF